MPNLRMKTHISFKRCKYIALQSLRKMLSFDEIREKLLNFKGVSEQFPFGEEHFVYKVLDKIFAILSINDKICVALKCDPLIIDEMRERYSFLSHAPHFNKRHWNLVTVEHDASPSIIFEMIEHSYHQVVKGFTKVKRSELENLKDVDI